MKPATLSVEYCDGKRAYDKKTAITAANDRYRKERVVLRIYQCHGTHWHLTKRVHEGRDGRYRQGRYTTKHAEDD